MPAVRGLALTAALLVAVVLQVSFFSWFAYDGVVPNLVLLLVVAAGLVRGPEVAAMLAMVGGFALDLVPPAEHTAGRWALALVLVGVLAGSVRRDAAGRSAAVPLATVAAGSLLATSVFALSGMLLGDPGVPAAEALRVIPVSLAYDLLLAPFVLPPALRLLRGLQPPRVVVV